jgi:catechol 2,3-dioxygenase-like lactoylglutathione lyase family enzyme
MLHHVSVGVGDVARAASFYDPVLKALGYKRVMEFMPYAIGYGERGGHPEFWIQLPHNQKTATAGNGTHVGFAARTKAQVNAFHSAALAAGGSNDGEPGPRPDYGPEYYGAFTYDLDGNKVEATLHVLVRDVAKAAAKRPAKKAKKVAKKTKAKKSPAKKKKRR